MAVTTDSASSAEALTKSDATDVPFGQTRAVYVGGAGDISVNMVGSGAAIVFKAVPAGTLLPIRITRLLSTGTTATDCVGLR